MSYRERRLRLAALVVALLSLSGMAAAAEPDGYAAATAPAPATPATPSERDARCAGGSEAGRPLPQAIGPELVEFASSPFPYDGIIPGDNKAFLDVNSGGRRGHTSPRGFLHWEHDSYSDRHTLLYLPKGFDLSRPALMVVFFHGNHATLARDVQRRQRVPAQLAGSGLNAVLVAPQFARDAGDSSAGWFWQPGVFSRFLDEAAQHLAQLYGNPCLQAAFAKLPVVLVAYSGGYDPAAYALDVGGAGERIHGVILLDALYGETEKFDRWLDRRGNAFFFSAYTESSQPENLVLQRSLAARHVPVNPAGQPPSLRPGSITFLAAGQGIRHNDFLTDAWVRNPLAVVLATIDGFRLRPAPARPHAAPPRTSPRKAPGAR